MSRDLPEPIFSEESSNPLSTNRRKLLRLAAMGFLGAGVTTVGGCVRSANRPLEPEPLAEPAIALTVEGEASLKERAAAKGILYGAATERSTLESDATYRNSFVRECGVLTPENDLKWYALRPSRDEYNFGSGDWLLNFARTHNQKFEDTPLFGEQALPDWFESTVNSSNAERFLVDHITRVVRHYAGRIYSWDVVNEGVSVRYSDRPDGLSYSPWLKLLGRDYFDLAFRTAAAADPQARLVYNDRWLDYDTPEDERQRRKVLELLEYFKTQRTPVHALGIQAHLFAAAQTRFNPTVLRNFLRDVASMGFEILITELDVADKDLPADLAERDRRVARAYEDYLTTALDEPAVTTVVTWGLSDRYTWLTRFVPRSDGRPVRVLPLDDQLQRKLAWQAIARAFDQAPRRSPA